MNTDKIYAESVANEYAKKEATKVVQLKKLDRRAKLPANVFAYTFGIAAALVLGIGMCLAMKVIGAGTTGTMVLGIVIGAAGIAGIAVNYPAYKKILARGKRKYASDILRLAREIVGEESEQ